MYLVSASGFCHLGSSMHECTFARKTLELSLEQMGEAMTLLL